MNISLYKNEIKIEMEKSIENYEVNIAKISAGRANPQILDNIKIIYYDSPIPINQIATISIPNPTQLLIKPYDISYVKNIINAIKISSLGIHIIDEGEKIRINFPEITTERRKELVKSLTSYKEQAKIKIRLSRQDINKLIKKDDELSEDQEKNYLEEIQNITNKYINEIDSITKEKEQSLMKI